MKREYLVGEPMEEYAARRRAEIAEEKAYEVRIVGFGGRRPFVPSDLPNLAAWFALGRSITSSGGLVSQWDDQSGLGRHLKQPTGTNQPALQGDGSILFDAVDNFLMCDAFTLNQPCTVYALLRQITWGSALRIFDGNAGNTGALIQSTGGASPQLRIFAGSNLGENSNLATGAYGVVAAVFNGASSVLQINNTAPLTGDSGASNMGGFTLGAGGALTGFSNIQAKEVIIYASAHDTNQRQTVINYLTGVGSL